MRWVNAHTRNHPNAWSPITVKSITSMKKKTRYQEIFFLYYFIFSFKGRQGLKWNTRGISVPGNKLAEGKLEIMMIMMILTYTSSSHISFMKMIRYSKNSSLDCGCPHNEIRVTAGQRFLIMWKTLRWNIATFHYLISYYFTADIKSNPAPSFH